MVTDSISTDATDEPAVCRAARDLLGRIIVGHGVSLRITEVEAYDGVNDPAAHSYRRTPRSETMFGPPWRLYVYQIHTHHCANIVTSPEGEGSAVLLRAGEVVDGLPLALSRRGDVPARRLARGPGNLARALGITKSDLGTDVTDPDSDVHLRDDRVPPIRITVGPRVGIRQAADEPWRFWIDGDPTVSPYRRHPRAL